ncbi:MAG: hypothetical protein LBC98_00495 [Prevotellaceae bacterium]|jgi:hypothetical protein|nr:hypothetical protein [Prevotellaceae bacterium]
MKTNFYNFTLLAISFLIYSCTRECKDCGLGSMVANYVQKYIEVDSTLILSVSKYDDSDSLPSWSVIFSSNIISDFSSDSAVRTKFKHYAVMNVDTNYFKPLGTCFFEPCLPFGNNRFDIYCEQDYGGIPAGQSLNHICIAYCHSVQNFVESKYSLYPDETIPFTKDVIYDTLTYFNRRNTRLLSALDIRLYLVLRPLEPADYRFVFKYEDDSGIVLTDTVVSSVK